MPAVVPALGTDIVSVARVERMLADPGRFVDRWFTPTEISYCESKAAPARHLAARLAAKEAVVKALRARWDGPLGYRDVEIVNDGAGAPWVRLHAAVASLALRRGVTGLQISMSHCDDYATAVALVATR